MGELFKDRPSERSAKGPSSEEVVEQFEERKAEHIEFALRPKNEAVGMNGLDRVVLPHNALPEIDLDDVTLETSILGQKARTPFYVSAMTAGHHQGEQLNLTLARACEENQWILGVGSQRRQLYDRSADHEWVAVREQAPSAVILANLGLTQVIQTPVSDIKKVISSLKADALVVHTNPLQEAIQPEGTPFFSGGLEALKQLCRKLRVPVVLKETGCGISRDVAERVKGIGLAAVDVSGFGGTHWGRLEGDRSREGSVFRRASETLANWGVPTVESVRNCMDVDPDYEVWGSGGVRTGLDAIKLIYLGANAIGFAKPALQAALEGEEELNLWMSKIEYEARVSLFCMGLENVGSVCGRGRIDGR